MKLSSLIIVFAALLTLIACNTKTETSGTNSEQTPSEESAKHLCYRHFMNKDTVKMSLTINGKEVSGDLTYNLFEKDRNTGKFHGTISGDTITADYDFQSEGMMSTRKVIFLRKNNALVEGNDGTFEGLTLLESACDD